MGNRTGSIAVRRERRDLARKPKFGGPDATGEGPLRGVPRCLNTDALGLHSKGGVGCRKRTRWMEAGVSRLRHEAQKQSSNPVAGGVSASWQVGDVRRFANRYGGSRPQADVAATAPIELKWLTVRLICCEPKSGEPYDLASPGDCA